MLEPSQLATAYGVNQITFSSLGGAALGAGQTIAIVDAYGDPNIASNLATFDTEFGIAAPPSFKVVNQHGSTTGLPSGDPTYGWELEESLDVEYAHAIAPGRTSCWSRPIRIPTPIC